MTPCGLVDYAPVERVPEHGRCPGTSEKTQVSTAIQSCSGVQQEGYRNRGIWTQDMKG